MRALWALSFVSVGIFLFGVLAFKFALTCRSVVSVDRGATVPGAEAEVPFETEHPRRLLRHQRDTHRPAAHCV